MLRPGCHDRRRTHPTTCQELMTNMDVVTPPGPMTGYYAQVVHPDVPSGSGLEDGLVGLATDEHGPVPPWRHGHENWTWSFFTVGFHDRVAHRHANVEAFAVLVVGPHVDPVGRTAPVARHGRDLTIAVLRHERPGSDRLGHAALHGASDRDHEGHDWYCDGEQMAGRRRVGPDVGPSVLRVSELGTVIMLYGTEGFYRIFLDLRQQKSVTPGVGAVRRII